MQGVTHMAVRKDLQGFWGLAPGHQAGSKCLCPLSHITEDLKVILVHGLRGTSVHLFREGMAVEAAPVLLPCACDTMANPQDL